MIRIGILGSENSHALAFSKLVNLPDEKSGEYAFPDMKVTHVYGFDAKQAAEVAAAGKVENVAEKPEDIMGKVDAVMVVFRHGGLHASHALPFVRAGVPVWVDKPFTVKTEDALELVEAAAKYNTLITGGSTCKYVYDVLMLKNAVETKTQTGNVVLGSLNFPADPESEYGGIFFYGAHLVEMMMMIFGYDVKSVSTSRNNGSIVAIAQYDEYQVVMNFAKKFGRYLGVVYGEKGNVVREIDISLAYRLGFAKFAEMLHTGKMPLTPEQLIAPVTLLEQIEKSLKAEN